MVGECVHWQSSPIWTTLGTNHFLAVADALLWIMIRNGVSWEIHYVDDFFTIDRPDSDECIENMTLMHQICVEAGLPLEPSKRTTTYNHFPGHRIRFSPWRCVSRKISWPMSLTCSYIGAIKELVTSRTFSPWLKHLLMPAKSSEAVGYFSADLLIYLQQ